MAVGFQTCEWTCLREGSYVLGARDIKHVLGPGVFSLLWRHLFRSRVPESTEHLCCREGAEVVAFAAYQYGWGEFGVFWMIFLEMIPLAKILGDIIEELATSPGKTLSSGMP